MEALFLRLCLGAEVLGYEQVWMRVALFLL